jgi:hypothetical protein
VIGAEPACRIITFYSYKGGTGRSMALANVAWILASAGKRVLAIDWDLEAPGLHRYLHPFLPDREVATTPGLMDFLWEFVLKARDEPATRSSDWYVPYTDLIRCAIPVDWDFPGEGVLHLVSAGRQDHDYPRLVAQFDWNAFYRDLRGGVFLEVVKKQLRSRYDYVLIDSRTGLSDTSGICAVQMPDDLVCCFTMNSQNILGTAAVTESAFLQRMKPSGEPGLIIWPLPTRVEAAERDRLERARTFARLQFTAYLKHLTREERDAYWRRVEVPYQPYYAYEEVLATFRDKPQQPTGSLLYPLEELTRYLTRGDVRQMAPMPERTRHEVLEKFTRHTVARDLVVLVDDGSQPEAAPLVEKIRAEILHQFDNVEVVTASSIRASNEDRPHQVPPRVDLTVLVVTKDRGAMDKSIVQAGGAMQNLLTVGGAFDCTSIFEPTFDADLRALIGQIKSMLVESARAIVDPDDPQKGRWGGAASANGRHLSAAVSPITADWFNIRLMITGTDTKPLQGDVTFFLHPTFQPDHRRVPVINGTAILELTSWGAFTVGAICDAGVTRLELDLAEQPGLDPVFQSR